MSPRSAVRIALWLALVMGAPAAAQIADSTAADSSATPSFTADSLATDPTGAVLDFPTARMDTLAPSARPAPPAEGGLEQPVTYTARDSLRILLAPRTEADSAAADTARADDRAWLYGDVTAQYEDATLSAAVLELRFATQELRALPLETDTGRVGVPRFAQGEEAFTGREFVYNLESRRGRVVGARTEIEDGYLLGGVIKQADLHTIYAADAAYTTCNLDHPHYALEAGRMKIVDGEYVYTGPVQLRLLGIPTPLWLPFGFFPAAEGRRSGPLPVSYGEDRDAFGFYLDNVGWYWAVSDYFDVLVRGKLGTRGSYQIGARTNYVRRYAYDGTLEVTYARLRRGERLDPDFALSQTARIRWNHAQTFTPDTRLNAAVDLTSNTQRFLSESFDDRVAQTSTSTIAFNRNWPRAGRSLALDLRATQQLSTGGADLTLPTLRFNQQRRFPFRRERRAGRDEAWYEKIGLSYTGSLTNTYSFAPLADSTLAGTGFEDVSWVDALFDYDAYVGATGRTERFRPQAQHRVPVSAAFTLNRFRLNWSPSVTYSEDWFARSDRRVLDSTGAVVTRQEDGFTAVRRVNLGMSANTEFYGTFPVRVGAFDGLRHVVRPQVAFTYEPDYSAAPFDYFRTVTDTSGQVIEYPIVAGLPSRTTQRLSFSLGNVFQTRRVRTDSTGEETREALQLFTLGLRSAYDFAAEERPFGDVALDLTSQHGRFRARLDAAFSPYALDSLGAPTPTPYLTETGRLLRVTRVGLSAGASFRSGSAGGRPGGLAPGLPPPPGYDPAAPDYGLIPSGVVDFAVPWSLALDFTYGYTPARTPGGEAQQSAVLSITNLDVSLTPNWKVAGRTGYDFERGELATTQLSILRDLHCWEMRFNWVPFGDFRSFSFSIYVKSGYLRDLLRLDFPRAEIGNRFGNLF